MKKSRSLLLAGVLQVFAVGLLVYSLYTYFSVEFDARDNMWPFARYYLAMYKHELLFMFMSFITLVISIFLKNILQQEGGRALIIAEGYLIKVIIVVALISSLSAMHTVQYTNDFMAYLPISGFTILGCFALVILNTFVLIREIAFKMKRQIN